MLRADAEVVYRRARMHLGLVTIFRARSRLGRLEQLSREVDANDGIRALDRATLQADIRALSARLGTGSWLPVAEGYMSASRLTVGPEHFRLISNAAMAIWQSDGNKNLAQRTWAEVSAKAGPDSAVPTLCLAAAEPDHAKAIALLEPLSSSDLTGIQALVRAWLAAREQQRGSPVRARKFANEWAKAMSHVPPSRQALASGEGGLALVRPVRLAPPLRQRSEFLRFAYDVTIVPALWLVPPAPLDTKAMQALAKER